MKSLSKQQRDYFIDRIKGEINKEISILEQIHATGIETVANKQYKSYLKDTGLKLRDLKTEQSNLEKIFVNLVKENNEI